MTRAGEIIGCYNWLYGEPPARIPFNRAQRWTWSQLYWMMRDLDIFSKMLEEADMISELRKVVGAGEESNLMGDWRDC